MKNIKKTKEIILPEHDFIKNKGSFDDLISTLKINKEILHSNTKDFFKLLHSEFKYSIMSNGGWQSLPLPRTLKEGYVVDNYEHLLHKKIRSKKNFKIQYYVRNNTLIVFSRGTKIEVKHHKELVLIIDNINTHKEYLVIEILENLSKEWPIEAGLYFLSELYNYRGIDIV